MRKSDSFCRHAKASLLEKDSPGALEYADEAEITTLLDFDGESVPTGEQTVEPRVLTVQTEDLTVSRRETVAK